MKKRIMMNIVAVFICALVLAGCTGGGSKEPQAPFEVMVDEVFICNTYGGEVLVINLEVTNTSEEYLDGFMVPYSLDVRINGKALGYGYLSTDHEKVINSDIKLASDETEILQAVYELTGEAEGELTILGVTYAINMDTQVEFLNETIDMADVEKLIEESSYELTIDNVVKTDDGEGNDLIVIDMTFTNNSDEAEAFSYAIDLEIFQNGVELKRGYLPYRHPLEEDDISDNNRLAIKENSIQVREVYILNDAEAPIEVKAVESMSYGTEPLLENEIQIQ